MAKDSDYHHSCSTNLIYATKPEKAGCTLIYLPVYSPDLNSIEHCWANFKNYLRKINDAPRSRATRYLKKF
ncbi:transposase [Rickettsia endosymbiont of Urophora cardui]|uniref:transposase n=1 Tax=Rickettsia endosymbiont of Urophora cardui TaxID=3066265 RepID=UPI00313C72F3